MEIIRVKDALAAAEEFLKRGRMIQFSKYGSVEQGKDSAALRRASLDLTRALAEMRNAHLTRG
jgi:hypothetical protein